MIQSRSTLRELAKDGDRVVVTDQPFYWFLEYVIDGRYKFVYPVFVVDLD